MAKKLEGKRILLTGASRGVGRASAELFIKEGAHVFGVARDEARLKKATLELTEFGPGTFTSLATDLGDKDAGARIFAALDEKWGAVDIVVQNAGVMLHHDAEIMAEPEGILEQSLDLNVLAPFRLTRAVLPLLKKGTEPRLLNVGSGAGTHHGLTEPGIASYRLSKWALHGLSLLQARELDGSVCVNAFDPGWIKTDLGGPNAPGTPEEAANGLLNSLLLPWNEKGKFLKNGEEIPW